MKGDFRDGKGEGERKRERERERERERKREREGMDLLPGLSIGMAPTTTSKNTKEGTTGIINYCKLHVQYVQLFIVTATITRGKVEIGIRTRIVMIIL